MKIQTIEKQVRRDFWVVYECEHCGQTHKGTGYDDDNFHVNVIPAMKCPACGKYADMETYVPRQTKYAPWEII